MRNCPIYLNRFPVSFGSILPIQQMRQRAQCEQQARSIEENGTMNETKQMLAWVVGGFARGTCGSECPALLDLDNVARYYCRHHDQKLSLR